MFGHPRTQNFQDTHPPSPPPPRPVGLPLILGPYPLVSHPKPQQPLCSPHGSTTEIAFIVSNHDFPPVPLLITSGLGHATSTQAQVLQYLGACCYASAPQHTLSFYPPPFCVSYAKVPN